MSLNLRVLTATVIAALAPESTFAIVFWDGDVLVVGDVDWRLVSGSIWLVIQLFLGEHVIKGSSGLVPCEVFRIRCNLDLIFRRRGSQYVSLEN